jgi:SAM-dependent MidA family methyltransferase
VTRDAEKFSWTRLPLHDDPETLFHPFQIPPELAAVLPDGFTTEVCPAAAAWWRDAANALRAGKLLTIDYALNAEDFFSPARANGTLRAYSQHHVSADLIANPGQQDLTAHVNFSALQAAGESAGLTTDARISQAQFLTEIAARAWQSSPAPDAAGLRQFQTLTHPEHLGHRFSVLVQSRAGDR